MCAGVSGGRGRDNSPMATPCNIAAALAPLAARQPDGIAMRVPGRDGRYRQALTYAGLDRRSDAIAAGLATHGIVPGTRTAVMGRPTPALLPLLYALFKAGAVPVLVGPGLEKRALGDGLDE